MTASNPVSNDNRGVVSIASPYSFADTVHRLLSALGDHGVKIFAAIDQQAEASAVGLNLPPTTLILFGNPRAGTPLMLARPQSGIDLPFKVLISEPSPGHVSVTSNSASYIIDRHSLPPELESNLVLAEQLITKVLQS